jgi:hypothetical protein
MKIADNYSPNVNQNMTFTICLMNRSGTDQTISEVDDLFDDAFFYTNCGASAPGISCDHALGNGGTLRWFANFVVPNGQTVRLTVTGNYHAAGDYCNDGSKYTVLDSNSVPIGNPQGVCYTVRP